MNSRKVSADIFFVREDVIKSCNRVALSKKLFPNCLCLSLGRKNKGPSHSPFSNHDPVVFCIESTDVALRKIRGRKQLKPKVGGSAFVLFLRVKRNAGSFSKVANI